MEEGIFKSFAYVELQKQLDLEIRVANAQVEIVKEKDKEIAKLQSSVLDVSRKAFEELEKRNVEIASLKEALMKAQVILRNEDTQKYYTTTLDEEIERLLK